LPSCSLTCSILRGCSRSRPTAGEKEIASSLEKWRHSTSLSRKEASYLVKQSKRLANSIYLKACSWILMLLLLVRMICSLKVVIASKQVRI
jgi:hypothetical protein